VTKIRIAVFGVVMPSSDGVTIQTTVTCIYTMFTFHLIRTT